MGGAEVRQAEVVAQPDQRRLDDVPAARDRRQEVRLVDDHDALVAVHDPDRERDRRLDRQLAVEPQVRARLVGGVAGRSDPSARRRGARPASLRRPPPRPGARGVRRGARAWSTSAGRRACRRTASRPWRCGSGGVILVAAKDDAATAIPESRIPMPIPASNPTNEEESMAIKPHRQPQPRAHGAAVGAAGDRAQAPPGMIALGSGDPDFRTPEHIRQAMIDAVNAGYSNYPPAVATPICWPRIAAPCSGAHGQAWDPATSPLPSAAPARSSPRMLGYLNPGDSVLIPEPTYSQYADIARLAGASRLRAQTEDFHLDLDALRAAAAQHRPKMHRHFSPNNPTGAHLRPRRTGGAGRGSPSSTTCWCWPTRSTTTWSTTDRRVRLHAGDPRLPRPAALRQSFSKTSR